MELKILSRCPTCHNQTLFLSDHGALVCSWIECKEPCVDRAIESIQTRLAACEAELVKWQRIRTPTHGPCCTCQKCGQRYDECRCDLDEVVDELEQTKARVQALEQEQARLKEALRLVVQVGENVLKPKFDHCGAMNATQLADRDCVLNVLEQARHALEGG